MATVLPANGFEFLLVDDNGEGVLLNTDVTPSAPFVDIDDVSGLDQPDYRETFRDHEGTDGGFLDAEFEKGRDIYLTGTVIGPEAMMESYLDSIKANYSPRLSSQPLMRFYFYVQGVGLRFLYVKPRGVRYTWSQMRRTGQVPIQFRMFAEDPRIYSYPSNQVVIPLTLNQTNGFGFNLGFSFGFGGMTTPDGFNAVNNGNRPAPLLVKIMGPVGKPRLLNDTNGGLVVVNLGVRQNDFLVVDMVNHSVTFNGVNRRDVILEDDWFNIEKGNNALRFQDGNVDVVDAVQNPPLNSNYNFESGISPWTASNGTLMQSNDYALFGRYSGKMVSDGSGQNIGPLSDFIAATANTQYTASGWVYSLEAWAMQISMAWYDGSQVLLTSSFGATVNVPAKTWTRLSATATSPASTAFAKFRASRTAASTNPPVGFTYYTDMAVFNLGPNAPAFAQFEWASAWR